MSINVTIIEEAGHKSALLGLSLSYYREGQPLSEFWTEDKITKALKRAKLLAPKGGWSQQVSRIHSSLGNHQSTSVLVG